MQGQKTGGRASGTPNKSTQKLKSFLDTVFTEAFEGPGSEELRKKLVQQIQSLSLDSKLLTYLLSQWAGAPRQAVDVSVEKLTLEQIIAGKVPQDDAPEGSE